MKPAYPEFAEPKVEDEVKPNNRYFGIPIKTKKKREKATLKSVYIIEKLIYQWYPDKPGAEVSSP